MINNERWRNRSLRVLVLLAVFILWLDASLPISVRGQKLSPENKSMQNLTDGQVVAELSSQDEGVAHQAVEEVMWRGDRIIPLLLRCKGNEKFFYGYGLGHHLSSFIIPLPTSNKEVSDGSFITVEVAALYLISAIYHKTLEFAQAPYLTNGESVKGQRFNTPERVSKAWSSVEVWAQAFKKSGLEALRAKNQSPLSGSGIHFWGKQ